MLLPVAPEASEDNILSAANEALKNVKVAVEDRPAWLRLEYDEWRQTGTASARFKRVLRAMVNTSTGQFGEQLGSNYFEVHQKLIAAHGLSFGEATELLSHAV